MGTLRFNNGRRSHVLRLGYLDPIETMSGIQARLRNLGYYGGVVDGNSNRLVEDALRTFQKQVGLSSTGQADEATLDALKSAFGA